MSMTNRPVLQLLLLLSIGLRTVFGAPCCLDMEASGGHEHHHHHAAHAHEGHSMAGDARDGSGERDGSAHDNTANPCCSACGPTLPPDIVRLNAPSLARALPEPTPVRSLKTRPPYPAYEATGPPALI